MREAMSLLNLPGCTYRRTQSVKLARMNADLAESDEIETEANFFEKVCLNTKFVTGVVCHSICNGPNTECLSRFPNPVLMKMSGLDKSGNV